MKNFFLGGKNKKKIEKKSSGSRPGEKTTYLTGDDRVDSAKIKTLLETMGEMISSMEPDNLLQIIVDRSIRLVGAERGILFLKEKDGALAIKVARDAKGNNLKGDIQYSTGVLKKVITTGEPVLLKVGASEITDLSQSVVDLKLRAVMCVTLSVKEKIIGGIYVDSRATSREFKQSDLKFFDALANAMAITLENARLVSRYVESERLKKSMEIARSIQQGLLPRNPTQIKNFDIAGALKPVEAAAGDYYDFIRIPPDQIGLVVGDVTGHGIGPAIVMSSARSMIRGLILSEFRVEKILERLNDHIGRDTDAGMFMSLFMGAIDLKNKRLVYGSAGHIPQLLYRARTEEFIELPRTGMALGVEEGMPYKASDWINLEEGDIITLFTDGIIETRGEDGYFGVDRLKELLVRCKEMPSVEIVSSVFATVENYDQSNAEKDDLTLVVIKVL